MLGKIFSSTSKAYLQKDFSMHIEAFHPVTFQNSSGSTNFSTPGARQCLVSLWTEILFAQWWTFEIMKTMQGYKGRKIGDNFARTKFSKSASKKNLSRKKLKMLSYAFKRGTSKGFIKGFKKHSTCT